MCGNFYYRDEFFALLRHFENVDELTFAEKDAGGVWLVTNLFLYITVSLAFAT
jgi:hypothetical protein